MAFKRYETDVLDKERTPDIAPVRDAYLQGYSQCETDLAGKPLTRGTLLWYLAAAAVSLGLWWLIYIGAKAIF